LKNKNILAYGIIGIIVVAAVYAFLLRTPSNNNNLVSSNNNNNTNLQSTSQLVANSRAAAIEKYQKQFCGLNSSPNSNDYITEYKLPAKCEMPLGILVDGQTGKVWYLSTKHGTLGSYNLIAHKFDRELTIPIWNVRNNPTDNSQVWSVKADKRGNIWFTDEKQNFLFSYYMFVHLSISRQERNR
jgi:virginiamycin B lyase